MNYYTDTIPLDLAEKLKEKGKNIPTIAKYIIGNQVREYDKDYDDDMPIIGKREYHDGDLITFDRIDIECNPVCCNAPTYAEVFDWLMEKGTYIIIGKLSGENYYFKYECARGDVGSLYNFPTWHEAANTAIEKILTMN